jgi:hypothetical protein
VTVPPSVGMFRSERRLRRRNRVRGVGSEGAVDTPSET